MILMTKFGNISIFFGICLLVNFFLIIFAAVNMLCAVGYLQVERRDGSGSAVRVLRVGSYRVPGFVQLYLEGNEAYFTLSSLEHKVLSYCMYCCGFVADGSGDVGNRVVINAGVRGEMRRMLGLSDGGIRNGLSSLVRKRQLLRGRLRGVYYLNPLYFFKGSVGKRAELVRCLEENELMR